MNKKKATCADIKEIVKLLKEHELKPDEDGLITIEYPDTEGTVINSETIEAGVRFLSKYNNPFYRDSVGGEELHETS